MAAYLCRTRALVPRYVPVLMARAQLAQTPGEGVPMSGSTKTVSQTGGTKKGDSSELPSSDTSKDHTNPMKTSSDTASKKASTSSQEAGSDKGGSSSSADKGSPSIFSSPLGQFGAVAVLVLSIYAGYTFWSKSQAVKSDKAITPGDPVKSTPDDTQKKSAPGH